jgi:hypothetical protein
MRAILGGAIVVLVAAALAGCGGDAAENSAATTTTSGSTPKRDSAEHRAFIVAADAICRKANEKEEALGAEGAGWIYTEQFDDAEFLADFNAIGAAALRDLRKLAPAGQDEEMAATALEAVDRMVTALDNRVSDLRPGKGPNRADQIGEYDRGYKDLAAAAGPLGLTECQGLSL